MAAPVDAGRLASTSGGTAQTTTITPSLPASIAAGNLLVLWVAVHNSQTGAVPSGWTKLYDAIPTIPTNHDNVWQAVFYKGVASGSEGATLSIPITGSARWSACAWRITGHETTGTFIEISADSNQIATTAPDPPALTPAGGSADYLAIWCGLAGGTPTMPPSGTPTGYSNPIGAASGGSGSATTKPCAFGATKQLTAAITENPPTWTLSASSLCSAQTIMVYPPSAPPPVVEMAQYMEPTVISQSRQRALQARRF